MCEVACEYPEGFLVKIVDLRKASWSFSMDLRGSNIFWDPPVETGVRWGSHKNHFRILNFGWKSTLTWFFPRLGYVGALTSNRAVWFATLAEYVGWCLGTIVHAWLLAGVPCLEAFCGVLFSVLRKLFRFSYLGSMLWVNLGVQRF